MSREIRSSAIEFENVHCAWYRKWTLDPSSDLLEVNVDHLFLVSTRVSPALD